MKSLRFATISGPEIIQMKVTLQGCMPGQHGQCTRFTWNRVQLEELAASEPSGIGCKSALQPQLCVKSASATDRATLAATSEQPMSQCGLKSSSYDRIIHETKTQKQRVIWSAYTNEAEQWWDDREGGLQPMRNMWDVKCNLVPLVWKTFQRKREKNQKKKTTFGTSNQSGLLRIVAVVQKRLFTPKIAVCNTVDLNHLWGILPGAASNEVIAC